MAIKRYRDRETGKITTYNDSTMGEGLLDSLVKKAATKATSKTANNLAVKGATKAIEEICGKTGQLIGETVFNKLSSPPVIVKPPIPENKGDIIVRKATKRDQKENHQEGNV